MEERLVDATGRELWAYYSRRTCQNQLEGFWEDGYFHFLLVPLNLAIGFWVGARGKAHQHPKPLAELLSELGGELRTLIGPYYVL